MKKGTCVELSPWSLIYDAGVLFSRKLEEGEPSMNKRLMDKCGGQQRRLIFFIVISLVLLLQSPSLEAQGTIRVWHDGALAGEWLETSDNQVFIAMNISSEGLSGLSGEDLEAQRFLNWLYYGGAQIKASPSSWRSFIIDYITEKEYSQFLDYGVATGKWHEEYIQEVYGDALPMAMSTRNIGSYQAYMFVSGTPGERTTTNYFVQLEDETRQGVYIAAHINYQEGMRSYSYQDYENQLERILSNLRFELVREGAATSPSNGDTVLPPPDDGVPWTTVVGGTAAVAAAAATLVARAKKNKKIGKEEGDKPDDPEETVGYVLQLSAERVEVSPEEQAILQITAWRVDSTGAYQEAGEVTLEIQVPSDSGLTLVPLTGQGRMECRISQTGNPPAGPVVLTIIGTAPEGETRASVTVITEKPQYFLIVR